MSKFINEDELFKALASECKYLTASCNDCRNKCDLYAIIYYQKDIVRCKNCKHYRYYGLSAETVSECIIDHCDNPDADWFCADGERIE